MLSILVAEENEWSEDGHLRGTSKDAFEDPVGGSQQASKLVGSSAGQVRSLEDGVDAAARPAGVLWVRSDNQSMSNTGALSII